jgi:prevent-host-death family protein
MVASIAKRPAEVSEHKGNKRGIVKLPPRIAQSVAGWRNPSRQLISLLLGEMFGRTEGGATGSVDSSRAIGPEAIGAASSSAVGCNAINGYICPMTTVSISEIRKRLTELARRVEQGETIVVTRNGKPVLDLVPHKNVLDPVSHRKKGGIDLEAGWAYLRSLGIENPFPYIADDFDEPLPEDFLIRPLPPDAK